MPLLVRGGGGGKNTKDATAVPGDVRSGKTFYGANGKQTGIWTPKVTDYTGDATAVPSDVAKGEIFYNGQGRQVGIFDSPFPNIKQINISLKANVDYPVSNPIRIDKQGLVAFVCDYNSYTEDGTYLDNRNRIWGFKHLDIGGNKLLGVRFKNYFILHSGNERTPLCYIQYESDSDIITYKYDSAVYNQVSHNNFGFCFHNKSLYIGFINGTQINYDRFIMFHKDLNFTIYYE